MKKLIPALCMLLVAACLMGTSTYAWFAANETVTASGMQVKAASDGGLAIASYVAYATAPSASDFKSSAAANWTNGAGSVSPTSFDGAKWWTAEADKAESGAAKAGTYKDATPTEAEWTGGQGGKAIFQHTKWQVKSLAEGSTLTLKIDNVTVTGFNTSGTNQLLEKSLRVLVKCGANYYEFAPMYSTASASEQLYYNGTTAVQNTKLNFGNGAITAVEIGTVTDTAPTDVEVFVYFEGEDTNCMTQNIDINTLATLAVTINFTAK